MKQLSSTAPTLSNCDLNTPGINDKEANTSRNTYTLNNSTCRGFHCSACRSNCSKPNKKLTNNIVQHIVIPALAVLFIACTKPNENNSTPPRADQVTGLYIQEVPGSNPPQLERVEAYKISNDRYGLRKLSSTRFPGFTFVTDTSAGAAVVGAFLTTQYYLILPQSTDGVTITDTGHLTYNIDTKWLSFDVKDAATGNAVLFTARKQ